MTSNDFPATLTAALQKAGNGEKSITFINSRTSETSLTYKNLLDRATRLLYQFQKAGLRQGSELILLTESNEHFLEAFWAALLGGIIPVPLTSSSNNAALNRVLSVFQKLDQPFLWTSETSLSRLVKHAEKLHPPELIAKLQQNALLLDHVITDNNQGQTVETKPEDIAFIQFSSGSTGMPKGVVLTHHNLISNIYSILEGSKTTTDDISLSWMPLTHDMGIIGFHLSPLVVNADVYLMPPELFVRRPILWLEKISEKQATVSSSPNFGYLHLLKYFDYEKHKHIDLSSLRLIFNGAEPISADICHRFNRTLKPVGLSENVIFPVYGLAEASLAAAFSDPADPVLSIHVRRDKLHLGQDVSVQNKASSNTLEMVLLGGSLVNTDLRIVNQEGTVLKEHQVGFVLIHGENVTHRYYRDDSLTSEVISADKWLNTGDLGFLHQGQLVITGRYKDMIIVNGQNFHPHDLEELCATNTSLDVDKIAACSVSSIFGEEIAVFIVYRGELDQFLPLASEIRQTLSREAGCEVAQVIPVPSFPKTTSGKVQRFLLAENYSEGQFAEIINIMQGMLQPEVVDNNSLSDIERNLLEISKSIITDRNINVDDDLFELGTSSLNLVQIHERVDKLYPDLVELTDLFDYPTISQLAAFLKKQTSSQ